MTINPLKLGALMAASALFGAVTLGSLTGFQANTAPKFAMVDISKVVDGSSLAATNNDALQAAKKSRNDTLQFIVNNLAMPTKDAQRFSDLSTKTTALTPAEKTELDKLRTSAEDTTRKQRELSTKASPTDDDKKSIESFGANVQGNRVLLQQLQGAYENDMQNMLDDLRGKTLDRVQEVVRKIGADKGYSVIYTTNTAPYAANDITADCLKVLKK